MAMSRAGSYLGKFLAPRVDRFLIPRTNGHLSTMGQDKVGLVTTTGAKSGKAHPQPLALLDGGDGLLAIGSNYGREKHPGWSANLLAHPDCIVELTVRLVPTGPNAGGRRARRRLVDGRRRLCRIRELPLELRAAADPDFPA